MMLEAMIRLAHTDTATTAKSKHIRAPAPPSTALETGWKSRLDAWHIAYDHPQTECVSDPVGSHDSMSAHCAATTELRFIY
jgi:hypothetical protein